MTVKECMADKFSGPYRIILKVNFLGINSTRKPLLIHGFSLVNIRLLTVYGTAFYAIMSEYILLYVHTSFVTKMSFRGQLYLKLSFEEVNHCFHHFTVANFVLSVDCY